MIEPTRRMSRHSLSVAVLIGILMLSCSFARGQEWPTKPVRIIVPFAAGGGVDILTRAVMAELGKQWKQPVIIDNRAGAGSLIGAEMVAKAPADGYTLMATVNQTLVGNRFLYRNLPYDADKSFSPIVLMVSSDQMLLANSAFAANSIPDLIALAKQQPGKIAYGSFGSGSQPQLLYETIKKRESVDIVHVPYKGITPNLVALAGGEVMLGTGSVAVAAPLISSGKIKPIAVAGRSRLAQYPNVSTSTEQGYPYAQTSIWYGLFAPAGTPQPIVDKIYRDVRAILADPAFAEQNATSRGLTVVAGDARELRKVIEDEVTITGEQIRAAGITPE